MNLYRKKASELFGGNSDFVVLRQFVTADIVDNRAEEVHCICNDVQFQQTDFQNQSQSGDVVETGDNKRKESFGNRALSYNVVKDIKQRINQLWTDCGMKEKMKPVPSLLQSEVGCVRQVRHYDYCSDICEDLRQTSV